mmetsp:Transcript_4572/g.9053  ORF Transcript_4572/g.9053 Transcript_4572/m.9053 type:complete len:81 (+) Transcript_4572:636-878(+)
MAVEAPLDGAAGLDVKDAKDWADKASRHPEGHHVGAQEAPQEAQLEVRWDLDWGDIREEEGPSLEAEGNKEDMTMVGVRS